MFNPEDHVKYKIRYNGEVPPQFTWFNIALLEQGMSFQRAKSLFDQMMEDLFAVKLNDDYCLMRGGHVVTVLSVELLPA